MITSVVHCNLETLLFEQRPSILRSLAIPTVDFGIERVVAHIFSTTVPLVILPSTIISVVETFGAGKGNVAEKFVVVNIVEIW